ncbi:MAG: hypothetical protein WA303_24660 [Bradyrhizobium sp.]
MVTETARSSSPLEPAVTGLVYSAWKSGNLVVFLEAVLTFRGIFGPIEIVTEYFFVRMAVASPRSSSKPFAGGYEPNSTPPIKSRSGPIKNQSGGLDSGTITTLNFQRLAASILLLEKR